MVLTGNDVLGVAEENTLVFFFIILDLFKSPDHYVLMCML